MGQRSTAGQAEHGAHQHQLQHRPLQIPARQAQIEAAIKQHQAHQQTHPWLQPGAQSVGLDPTEARMAQQQPCGQEQHHRRQATQAGQQLAKGA